MAEERDLTRVKALLDAIDPTHLSILNQLVELLHMIMERAAEKVAPCRLAVVCPINRVEDWLETSKQHEDKENCLMSQDWVNALTLLIDNKKTMFSSLTARNRCSFDPIQRLPLSLQYELGRQVFTLKL
jgi:hypothetical protein